MIMNTNENPWLFEICIALLHTFIWRAAQDSTLIDEQAQSYS